MGKLVPKIVPGDWNAVAYAIAKLDSKLNTGASPTFISIALSGLTASRLMATDASKVFESVADLTTWITGTANQVVVADDSDGTITLSLPQDIHTAATPTFASLTLSGLTATRLMASDGSKGLASVADLTSWIAGTTDHIDIANDGDGTITINLGANTQNVLDHFNGTFIEMISFTVSESGGTVTGSLEKQGGGDLTQRFSDGYTTLSPKTINLTAFVGTDSAPKEVFVYILQSAKTTLVASNSDWPATEHEKVANLLLRSANTTGTDAGALVNRNWNDHASDTVNQGMITHIEERLRQEPTQWKSGIALTLKNSAGASLTTGNSSTAVEIVTSAGETYQLHKQTFPAFDMYVNAADDVHVVNQPAGDGGSYKTTADLVSDIVSVADGTSIGTNKYFNLIIWGVQNRSGEASHVMVNLPTDQYNTEAAAINDASAFSIFSIPSIFKGEGFLIARLTFRLIAGPQWTYIAQEDLRGQVPPTAAGISLTTTDHALLSNLAFASASHTGFQASDAGLTSLAGLTYAAASFVKMTAANTFALRTIGETVDDLEGTIDHANLANLTIAAHDTTATGANLTSLTDNSIVNALHRHSELVASDGSPDPALIVDATGQVGIGLTPTRQLTIGGIDSSAVNTGPNIRVITDADAYPQYETFVYSHDNVAFVFDAYYDNGVWKSSDAGSNFALYKNGDNFGFWYTGGIAAGDDLTWNKTGLIIDATGKVGVGIRSAKTRLTVEGTITLKEQAAADGDNAGYGQLWVKDDDPCTLYFTGDTGVGVKLNFASNEHFTEASIDHTNIVAGDGSDHSFINQNVTTTGTPTFGNTTLGNNNLKGTIVTINDDDVMSFTPGEARGIIMFGSRVSEHGMKNGIFIYRTTTSVFLSAIIANNVTTATGVLTGTTGVDGQLTISVHTDGKIYIENRLGSIYYISYNLFGQV